MTKPRKHKKPKFKKERTWKHTHNEGSKYTHKKVVVREYDIKEFDEYLDKLVWGEIEK